MSGHEGGKDMKRSGEQRFGVVTLDGVRRGVEGGYTTCWAILAQELTG